MKNKLNALAALGAVVLFAIVAYYLYDTLRERTVTEKLAEIIHHEDQRYLSPEIEAYLSDDSIAVRDRAALAVGRIDHAHSGPLLMELLDDSAIGVAGRAAFALGLTSDTKLATPLIERAHDLPSSVAARAVEAAGRLADSTTPDVPKITLEFLEHPSPEVREAACYALFQAGAVDEAAALVPFIDKEPDSTVRMAALYALSRLSVPSAADVFVKYQADADPHARILAVQGLARVESPEAIRLLALSLNDSDKRVVASAIGGLRRKAGPQAAEYLGSKLKRATDEKLIIALIEALTGLESDQGVETARMHLNAGLSDNVTSAAIVYLATVTGDHAVSLIDSLLHGVPVPEVRAACAEAYRVIDDSRVIPRLAVLFADEDPLVRASAFDVLVTLDSTNRDFYIQKGLADPDFMPQILAIDQIGQHQLTDYLPNLVSLMAPENGANVDIRRSVVDAAGQLYDKLGTDSVLAQLLVDGLTDPDYVVRRATAEVYQGKAGLDRKGAIGKAETRISERKIEGALKKYVINPTATLVTNKGAIELTLRFDEAPLTVMNFIELAEDGFYDGLTFHRVVPNFVIQGGDPIGTGWGGPPWMIRSEWSDLPYDRGTVGMATSGKDTGGSQFFITHSPQHRLEARYTVFGQVTSGMDVVDAIVKGDVIQKIVIQEG